MNTTKKQSPLEFAACLLLQEVIEEETQRVTVDKLRKRNPTTTSKARLRLV